MRYLMKAIKAKIASDVASLNNRIFTSKVAEKKFLADGPYCRVVIVGQPDTDYAFNDTVGYDLTTIQFSVFGESLVGADTLVDGIITAFNRVQLSMDVGGKATGRKLQRGVIVEPKSADSNQVFHCWVTVEFVYEDVLS
jgi:hypothetical protein